MAKRKFYRKIYQSNKKGRKKGFLLKFFRFGWLLGLLKVLLLGFFLFIFGFLFLFLYYAKDLPRPEKFQERPFVQSTKIYDRTGQVLLYELYGEEKRTLVSLDKIPQHLREAVIVAEDANFYSHFGVDPRGMARSLLINLKILKPVYGGSTIPQQLIRSVFFSSEKTIKRKIREIILALELDRRYSKDQILEWYLNQVPFGQNTYGVESASQTYFKKTVSEISLEEAATLAALIQAPSYLSPYGKNKDKLLARKNYILDRMRDLGYITAEEAEKAKEVEVSFAQVLRPIKAPHFVMEVKKYLTEKYGEDFLEKGGLRVYTSLDWELQEIAEKVVREGAKRNKNYRAYNASLVAIDPKTGQVLAMVGSKDWFATSSYPEGCQEGVNCLFEPKVNVATYHIGRQPGSAFKPFVYATAFEKGYDDKYIVVDEETNFGLWGGKPYIPQNYDGRFRGPVTLRQALAQSLNVPSVKVLAYLAGLEDSIKMAKKMGITTLKKDPSFYGLAIVLGGGEVRLLDMVSAYGVFATDGLKLEPVIILKIEDAQGNLLEENKKTPKRVLSKNSARLINDILSDNTARAPMFGSKSVMYFENYQVAAKTGTTQNYRDAWIIGYTPSIVAGVWVGNNNNQPILKKPGIIVAGPIWRAFMEKALLKYPKENFEKPAP